MESPTQKQKKAKGGILSTFGLLGLVRNTTISLTLSCRASMLRVNAFYMEQHTCQIISSDFKCFQKLSFLKAHAKQPHIRKAFLAWFLLLRLQVIDRVSLTLARTFLNRNVVTGAFYSKWASKISPRFISAQYCRESLRTSLKYSGVRSPCC